MSSNTTNTTNTANTATKRRTNMKNCSIHLSTLLSSSTLRSSRGRSLLISLCLSSGFLLAIGVTLGPTLAQSGNQSDITGVDLVETGINVIPPSTPQGPEEPTLGNQQGELPGQPPLQNLAVRAFGTGRRFRRHQHVGVEDGPDFHAAG